MTSPINRSGVTTVELAPGNAGESSIARAEAASLLANNFIANKIREDITENVYPRGLHFRFPPEPNGYLHLGHAKAICVNFGLAEHFGGVCHLRMDDTNPDKESAEYVDGIKDAVHWLGFDWGTYDYRASDFFTRMLDFGETLIKEGFAYVDEESADEVREKRGSFNKPGIASKYRNRPVEESLTRYAEMRAGEIKAGGALLRARIDMAHRNLNMRDPALVRVKDGVHHATGKAGAMPMYDFAHPLSDAFEHVTHSLCTLEFEAHRPLYNWVVEHAFSLGVVDCKPAQIEFARLNISHTVTSKRALRTLVEGGFVDAWDDPRMPTLVGARRKGVPPEALRMFCERAGVAKADSMLPIERLDECVREVLNPTVIRRMAIVDAVPLTITNRDASWKDELIIANHPKDASMGERKVTFGSRLWIAREDIRATPEKGFWRVCPGAIVRLRHAYTIEVTAVDVDASGEIVGVTATVFEGSRDMKAPGVPKAKGNIHWVERDTGVPFDTHLFGHLFKDEKPDMSMPLEVLVNPESKRVVASYGEAAISAVGEGERVEFERTGYFIRDSKDPTVFNRICELKSGA